MKDINMYLVKVWGQQGIYTTQLQAAAGNKVYEHAVDKIHYHKVEELNNTACAWTILGVIQGYVEEGIRMLPVVDGWVRDPQGNKLRPVD